MSSVRSKALSLLGGAKGALFVVGSGLVGVLVGIALFTFTFANGFAYFGEDPATCKQCHAMDKHYNAWSAGSHKQVACQECHNPHGNVVSWLVSEADNGFWHSLKFTTGSYPQNIKIREHNADVLRDNCLKCHGNLVNDVRQTQIHSNQQIDCLRCHAEVGHKR